LEPCFTLKGSVFSFQLC